MQTATKQFQVRPGQQRGTTEIGWLHSHHSFSFGRYYDPNNMGYRSLRVINDDIVEAERRLRRAWARQHGDHHLGDQRHAAPR